MNAPLSRVLCLVVIGWSLLIAGCGSGASGGSPLDRLRQISPEWKDTTFETMKSPLGEFQYLSGNRDVNGTPYGFMGIRKSSENSVVVNIIVDGAARGEIVFDENGQAVPLDSSLGADVIKTLEPSAKEVAKAMLNF